MKYTAIEPQSTDWADDAISEVKADVDRRVSLYPSAKVILVDDPDWELECRLTEISLTSIQLLADEKLPENELVCIELPDHLLLGDVKRSVQRGRQFASYAARIVTMQKTAVRGASNVAKIDALMTDFHLQCKLRLSTIEASMANIETRIAIKAGIEAPLFQQPALSQSNEDAAESRANTATESSSESPSAAGKVDLNQMDLKKVDVRDLDFHADFNWPPPPCVVTVVDRNAPKSGSEGSANPFNVELPEVAAAPVFAGMPRRAGRRPWVISIGFAASVAILLCGISLFGRGYERASFIRRLSASQPRSASSLPSNGDQQTASKTSVHSDPVATPIPIAAPSIVHAAPPEALQPAAPAGAIKLHAAIKATGVSWIAACTEGKELFQGTLAPGDMRQLEFSRSAVVLIGNTTAVRIEVDGKPIDPLGVAGVVRAIELSPGSSRFLLLSDRDTARACGKERVREHSRSAE